MSVRILSPELQKKSEIELNEIPSRIQDDLKHIREWLAQQPHLTARTDDQWLLNFLRGCKFSLQRTKEKLDMFYTMKNMVPELMSNKDPLLPEIQAVLELGVCLPLPKVANGPQIILTRYAYDPLKVPVITTGKVTIMITEILLNEDDNSIIAGLHALFDMKSTTVNHILQFTPSLSKKIVMCVQYAYPFRVKGMHHINAPSWCETVFNLVKPIMSEKLRKRYLVYSENELDDLFKIIPKSILPKDYGGEGPTIAELTVYWKKKVESYRDWFLEDAKYRSNEELRPGKPYTSDEMFGIEGSFRKLDVD